MKPYSFIWVVRKWCGMRTHTVLRCFDNPEGLNCGDLLVGIVPELANGLIFGTVVTPRVSNPHDYVNHMFKRP
jgi:hypothetical protein